jgi:hypothetical protein
MNNSNLRDWLIPLLAAFAIYIPLSTVAPSPDRQSSTQPQSPAFIQVSPTVTPTPGRGPIFRMPGVAFLTVLVTILILIVYWHFFLWPFIPTVDGPKFDWFFKLALCVVPLMLVWALARSFWLWRAVKRLLRRLSWRPLISQYAAERSGEKRFSSLPPIDLMAPTPTYTALSLSVRQARSFYNALKPVPAPAEEHNQIGELVKEAESELSQALGADAEGKWQKALRNRRGAQAALAELNERAADLLEDSWGGGRRRGAGRRVA